MKFTNLSAHVVGSCDEQNKIKKGERERTQHHFIPTLEMTNKKEKKNRKKKNRDT